MFTLKFETSNAAFEGDAVHEISNILRDIQRNVNTGYLEGKIRDSNGNTIGRYQYKKS